MPGSQNIDVDREETGRKQMTKLRVPTIVLFLIAIALYFIAPRVAIGLAAIGLLFEGAAWISLFKGREGSKNEKS